MPAPLTITLPQTVLGGYTTTASTRTVSFGSATTPGADIVLELGHSGVTLPATVTDDAGNTYVKEAASTDAGSSRYCSIYRAAKARSASSVTVTTASATAIQIAAYEVTNVGGKSWSGQANSPGSFGVTGTCTGGEALFGCIQWTSTGGNATLTNPGTANGDAWTYQTQGTVGTACFQSSYFVGTTAGTRGPKFGTPGAVSFGVCGLALYPATPGTTVGVRALVSNPGGYTYAGAVTTLEAALNDVDDTTYIQSNTATANPSKSRYRLEPLEPKTAFSLDIRGLLSASQVGTLTVRLYEGATVRKTWTPTSPTTSVADLPTLTMNSSECAAVTSWNALDVDVEWSI